MDNLCVCGTCEMCLLVEQVNHARERVLMLPVLEWELEKAKEKSLHESFSDR